MNKVQNSGYLRSRDDNDEGDDDDDDMHSSNT